jgi:hypothetical protein
MLERASPASIMGRPPRSTSPDMRASSAIAQAAVSGALKPAFRDTSALRLDIARCTFWDTDLYGRGSNRSPIVPTS